MALGEQGLYPYSRLLIDLKNDDDKSIEDLGI